MPRRFAFPPQKTRVYFQRARVQRKCLGSMSVRIENRRLMPQDVRQIEENELGLEAEDQDNVHEAFPRPAPLWGYRGVWPALLWGHQTLPRGSPEAKKVREVYSHQPGQRRPSPGPTIRKAPNPAESYTRRYQVLPACRETGSQERPSVG